MGSLLRHFHCKNLEGGLTIAKVIVGIPSHNEEERILDCLKSLFEQTVQPDEIVVILDNCTDKTEDIALGVGASVFKTENNKNKKSGALNQFLTSRFEAEDFEGDTKVLIVDADSELAPEWLEVALQHPDCAVGGVFLGDGENGVLGSVQSLEFVRYAREIGRGKGKAKVLSGTSTLLSLSWLREVSEKRGTLLPGRRGEVYNENSIVEDFDLTLCLKKLGIRTISPKQCLVRTETMPTIRELWRQRLRWQSGTIQTLFVFGFNKLTFPYFFQQALRLGALAMLILLWSLSAAILLMGYIEFQPLWVGMGSVFYVERQVSAWRGSNKARLISATVILDLLYDFFIAAVTIVSCANLIRGKQLRWGIDTIDTVGQKP